MKSRNPNAGAVKMENMTSGNRQKRDVRFASRRALKFISTVSEAFEAGAATEVPLRFAAMKKRGRKARGAGR